MPDNFFFNSANKITPPNTTKVFKCLLAVCICPTMWPSP